GYGLRNPWRFSWDRATRDLYIGDVGQDEWEEVDVRTPKQQRSLNNYGWRVWEGRARFTSGQRTSRAGKLVFPIVTYKHDGGRCSVTGGYVYRSNAGPARTGIAAGKVGELHRQQVRLPGTADSSPIYLRGVRVRGRAHDVFFVTTSYGITVAVDARSGAILWRFKPRGYASWAGSDRITNSSPIADPTRRYVYAEAPNG